MQISHSHQTLFKSCVFYKAHVLIVIHHKESCAVLVVNYSKNLKIFKNTYKTKKKNKKIKGDFTLLLLWFRNGWKSCKQFQICRRLSSNCWHVTRCLADLWKWVYFFWIWRCLQCQWTLPLWRSLVISNWFRNNLSKISIFLL